MKPQAQFAFSLTETLVSLLLASVITLTLINQYLSVKRGYEHTESALGQAFDTALITEQLRDSIRRAGFTPCLNLDQLARWDSRNETSRIHAWALGQVHENSFSTSRMSEHYAVVNQIEDAQTLSVRGVVFRLNEVILLADCYHAEVQVIRAVKKRGDVQTLTLEKPLHFTYELPLYVGEWVEEAYFIQPNSQHKPALFYRWHGTDEVSAEVQSLQASVSQSKTATMVLIRLGFLNGKNTEFTTWVRA